LERRRRLLCYTPRTLDPAGRQRRLLLFSLLRSLSLTGERLERRRRLLCYTPRTLDPAGRQRRLLLFSLLRSLSPTEERLVRRRPLLCCTPQTLGPIGRQGRLLPFCTFHLERTINLAGRAPRSAYTSCLVVKCSS